MHRTAASGRSARSTDATGSSAHRRGGRSRPWRTSSLMPEESSSAAPDVRLAPARLRIIRGIHPSAARGETVERVARQSSAGCGAHTKAIVGIGCFKRALVAGRMAWWIGSPTRSCIAAGLAEVARLGEDRPLRRPRHGQLTCPDGCRYSGLGSRRELSIPGLLEIWDAWPSSVRSPSIGIGGLHLLSQDAQPYVARSAEVSIRPRSLNSA